MLITIRTVCSTLSAVYLLTFMVQPAVAQTQAYRFIKIADTSTPYPGDTGNFSGFMQPSLDGRNVAFVGEDELVDVAQLQCAQYSSLNEDTALFSTKFACIRVLFLLTPPCP